MVYILVKSGKKSWIRKAHELVNRFCDVALFLIGVKKVNYGKEQVDFSKKHIYVMNHSSHLDVFTCYSVIPDYYMKIIGKAEILTYPVFGFVLKNLFIAVDRADRKDTMKTMKTMENELEGGASILIFPEGTRRRGKELLGPLKTGAMRLAIKTGVPIVVVVMANSRDLMGTKSKILKPGKLHCYFHKPIQTNHLAPDDAVSLQEEIKAKFMSALLKHYPDGYFPD